MLGRSFWRQKFCLNLLISEQVLEKISEVGNPVKIDLERYGDFRRLPATSYLLKIKKSKEKLTSSIFKLETSPWCQKLCLALLISNLPSEKNSEVGNKLKIDREYGDFRICKKKMNFIKICRLAQFLS
jgi:hypothetical protein